jgi:eukaryotic-like serine/threonine-protein kinase
MLAQISRTRSLAIPLGVPAGPKTEYDGGRVSSFVQEGEVVAGKYRVDRVLGEGGMGIVVAATHLELDQQVALKFLLPSVATRPEIVQRFTREARAAAKIRSEHVARVLDVGTLDTGMPYMVMEYLEGEDLAQVIARRGALPVQEAVGYILQACEAVAEAHAVGIVHRDLKPANLFLAKRPSGPPAIKVLDFGISKVPSTAKDVALTSSTGVMGSPGYMSPEQMTAAIRADARSDVWSFGIVLHELLTRELPFDAESMPEIIAAILQQPHPAMGASRGDVPAGVQSVVDRCLEKEPGRRFGNVAELARALAPFGPARSALSVERIEHVLGLVEALEAPAEGEPAARVDSPTFSPTTRQPYGTVSRRWLLVPAALVGALVASGVIFAARRGSRAPLDTSSLPPSAVASPSLPAAATLDPLPALSGSTASSPPDTLSAVPAVSASTALARPAVRPRSSAHAAVSAAPASASAPRCHVVAFFDSEGNKHFKQECR